MHAVEGKRLVSALCYVVEAVVEHHREIIPLSFKEKVNSHIVPHTLFL